MIVVIDTNVILQARSPLHEFHPLLEAWKDGSFSLAVSTGILLEYQEVIAAEADGIIAEDYHFHTLIGSGYKPQRSRRRSYIRRHLSGA